MILHRSKRRAPRATASGRRGRLVGYGLAAMLPLVIGAGAAVGADKLPRIFSSIERGRWELRPIGARTGGVSICVTSDARSLAVLRGGGGDCRVFTTEDKPTKAVLNYSCSGGDQGLTRVRIEDPRLMIVEAQGIRDGNPFQAKYEARRTGGC